MLVYREIISTKQDIANITKILQSLKTKSEVIIIPLSDDADGGFYRLQQASMAPTWDNEEDKVWDEL